MALVRNQVVSLTVTTITPLHIGTGDRLAANLDYYVDGDATLVINADAALELVVETWQQRRVPYEEQLRRFNAELAQEEERIRRADERLRRQIEQFEESPPRRKDEYERQANRFREEAQRLKERKQRLAEHSANPPQPDDTGDLLPPELIAGSTFDQLVDGGLLPRDRLRERATVNGRPLVRYALNGRPASGEVYEQIKDVADRLYLPGSSLKGAIRSALAWDMAHSPAVAALQHAVKGGPKNADDAIEQEVFLGTLRTQRRINNTVRDVLRALRIGDSAPVAVAPDLLAVRIYRSRSAQGLIALEAIPVDVEFRAALQIEQYPFESGVARAVIDFGDWQRRLQPDELAAACRRRAGRLIDGELAYFNRQTDAAELVRFYADLRARLERMDARAFLLPIGWGAGWRSKTLDDRLRQGTDRDNAFAQIVQRHTLKKHKSAGFRPGDAFPETRKVIMRGALPWRPLGWVEARFDLNGER
ncbi:type III-A CRISPR-associated RAMP protein Csm5 [Roseiflexus castenholzii]|jgi:CRISPR-associated protein Csm5|uniref:CRISPR system Cms protein Csm5 n=1 Tax=Roseiflexus castenholzii (strain DSM 13941 / HLO8) TaxID=383372 RepID=A7NKP9_ROSCS|nr:type III-A CRISPR-associated RAMP protein Csm5 [Roseiflexus castenholzii]ABU58069.1 CRISPR-associated RAMP protein, Csm5 family [Roseiflexus castenholzii DSM 13941]